MSIYPSKPPPKVRLERRAPSCTRQCSNYGEMAFHLKILDGAISHYRCQACHGLTLVATGAEVVKRIAKIEKRTEPPQRPPKQFDPALADLSDLVAWLEAACLTLQKQARTDSEAYMLIYSISLVLNQRGKQATVTEREIWEGEVRAAARAVVEYLRGKP